MTSKVKNSKVKAQQEKSLKELDDWAESHLDAEIIDGSVVSTRNEQEAIKRKCVIIISTLLAHG
jgi:hypothetical protein